MEEKIVTTEPEATEEQEGFVPDVEASEQVSEQETFSEADAFDTTSILLKDEEPASQAAQAEEAPVQTKKKGKGKKRRKKKRKFYEFTPENDIKYRGPLSYRALRILGWMFFMVSLVGIIWNVVGKVNPAHMPSQRVLTVFSMFGDMMMPLFLIATFATILNGSKNFRSMLLLYGGASVLFYLVFLFLYERVIASSLAALLGVDHGTAVTLVETLLMRLTKGGFLAFNIFIDLFLCTLLAFFLIYRPKKVFVGKKVIIFRLFAILPIGYEVASFAVKMLAAYGTITLNPYIYPILTTKPPMTFFVFVVLTFFLKAREHIYRQKNGGSHEDYREFLKTKANSWRFSAFAAKIMIIAGILDLVLYIVMTVAFAADGLSGTEAVAEGNEQVIADMLTKVADIMMKCGVGQSSGLILVAPIVLLFSYTRSHKDTRFDTILPIVALFFIALITLEGVHQILVQAGGQLQDILQGLVGMVAGGE